MPMRNRVAPAPATAGIKRGDQVRVDDRARPRKNGPRAGRESGQAHGYVEARGHDQASYARESIEERQGRHLEKEGSMSISNVLLLCPSCNKGTRLGISFCPTGRKSGYAAGCGNTLEK